MNAQHRLVGVPAALVGFDEGQIFRADEFVQRRNGAEFLPARLRTVAEQGLGENGLADPARLIGGQDIGTADLELALAGALVAIALVVCLAPGRTHLDEKSALLGIEIIHLAPAGWTGRLTHKRRGDFYDWHNRSLSCFRNHFL